VRKAATDPIVVEAILDQLRESGARLCDIQFYSSIVQRLHEAYGHEAVAAALRRHHVEMRRAVSYQIRQQRGHVAWLKRQTSV
jgi:hypothetical protein